jgi:hypothetical protein
MAGTMSNFDFRNAIHSTFPIGSRTKVVSNNSLKLSDSIKSSIESWQHEHNIETRSEALALMISEYSEHATLVGFLTEWQNRIESAISTAKSENDLQDLLNLFNLFKIYLREAGEILSICRGENENRTNG